MTGQDIINGAIEGMEVTGQMATAAAPIVAAFNPAAGAILAIAGPLAQQISILEKKVVITLNEDMTREQVAAALANSVSAMWPEPPSIAKTA